MGKLSDALQKKDKELKVLGKPEEKTDSSNLHSLADIKASVAAKEEEQRVPEKPEEKADSGNLHSLTGKKVSVAGKEEEQKVPEKPEEKTDSRKLHSLAGKKASVTTKEEISEDIFDKKTQKNSSHFPTHGQPEAPLLKLPGDRDHGGIKPDDTNLGGHPVPPQAAFPNVGPASNGGGIKNYYKQDTVYYPIAPQAESNKENLEEPVLDKEEIAAKLLMYRKEYGKQSFKKAVAKNKKSKRRKEDLFTFVKPTSAISQYFKVAQTLLLQSMKGKKIRTILVSSSLPLEGKSFVASNLAVSIARGLDQHVLLVDADLKKPSLSEILKINSETGLSDFIVNEQYKLSDLIQKTKIPKLSFLPSGSDYENSSELLSSEVMKLFVQEVKYRYDDRYIIIDAPPAQLSETISIADKVDGVILVVRAGKTDRKLVMQTVESLGRKKIIGVILNYSSVKSKPYNNYYGK